MPGVLDYLHYDESYFSFGNSMFDTAVVHSAVNYLNSTFQVIEGEYALTMDTSNVVNLFHFSNDSLLTHNLKDSLPELQTKMERKLKAMVQNFNDVMLNNKMSAQ